MRFNYIKYIFTDTPEKAFSEKHIFNFFIFITSILFFLATVFNYMANFGIVTTISFTGGISLGVIYFISRFYAYNQKVVIIFIISSFLFLNGLFFTNFGYKGPIVYNFLTFGMAIMFFLNKKNQIIFLLLLLLNFVVLAVIEYVHPSYFGYYNSDSMRIIDHVVNLIFSLLILAFLFYLMIGYIKTQKFKAEESDRLKSSFLANMSHEIRTPLNGIVGFSHLLNEANITKEEKEHFTKIIQSNSSHLEGLINDLIDISIIEAKALSLSYSPINLNSFMNQNLKKFKTIIFAKQKNIEIYLSQGFPFDDSTVYIDKVRLNQIINNLVSNAISYSESDSIHFGYMLETNGKYVRFFVKDQGIGINTEDQKLIFKPFIKAKNAKFVSRGGTGIGLTIAKELIELMGGQIWLVSSENKGSNFYFTIPYYKSPIEIPSDITL